MTVSPQEGNAPSFTAEQSAALVAKNVSVALSAGAGCGKTSVLTERFVRSLAGEDRRPLKSLVAVTFTEKAASELRKRIRDECRKRLTVAAPEEVAHWRGILRGLESAPVSTFHEYCAGLLRRHAVISGIDPDFKILDPILAGPILEEALDRCLRKWLASQDPDLFELGVEYGLSRVRGAIASLCSRRDAAELADWSARDVEEVFETWSSQWKRRGLPSILGKFVTEAEACRNLLRDHRCRHPKMQERVRVILGTLPAIQALPEPSAVLELLRESARVQGGGKAADWPSAEIYDRVKNALSALRDSIKDLQAKLEIDEETSRRCATLGLKLARLAAEARAAYDALKADHGGLDFDDLLLKTRDLLAADAATVREASGTPVEFVLVDEFQDTDPVQSEILRSLSGGAFLNGGLFVVGDFKQSIYRFRGARPEIFEQYRAEFPDEGNLQLSENFRSGPGVIHFVNALYAESFPPGEPRLLPGPNARSAVDGPAVEFLWAEEPSPLRIREDSRVKISVDEQRRVEARWLARLIRSRLDHGWPIVDRKTHQNRNADAGDVVLLFRAMTDVASYEHAFESEGLDFHVVGGSAFYAQQEIQDLVNVLTVIEDPLNSVALAGALRSPFFSLSDEGLFWLSTGGAVTLAAGLEKTAAEKVEGISDRDQSLAIRAFGLLERWRGLKDNVPISALVDRVLDESGFEAALLAERLGDRKRANARKFVQLARRFDSAGEYTLGHFVARLRGDLREPPKEGQAATTDEDGKSVRLMSIHQSKGLEFPIVIVPDLNRKSVGRRGTVAFDPALGVLVRPPAQPEASAEASESSGRSLGMMTFEAIESVEEDDEATRLFYVATTRARDVLILSAGVGPEAKPDSTAMRLLEARFDRATGACKADLPGGWEYPEVNVILDPPRSTGPILPRHKPDFARVVDVIESAKVYELAGEPRKGHRPRLVDLDQARGLLPARARIDRVIRGVLADPRGLDPTADLTKSVIRRLDPLISEALRSGVAERLRIWADGDVSRRLVQVKTLERAVSWSVTWPRDEAQSTVFLGRTEYSAMGADETCEIVNVCAVESPESLERLRLLLSARAAEGLGWGKVVKASLIRLGKETTVIVLDDFSDRAIEDAVEVSGVCV